MWFVVGWPGMNNLCFFNVKVIKNLHHPKAFLLFEFLNINIGNNPNIKKPKNSDKHDIPKVLQPTFISDKNMCFNIFYVVCHKISSWSVLHQSKKKYHLLKIHLTIFDI